MTDGAYCRAYPATRPTNLGTYEPIIGQYCRLHFPDGSVSAGQIINVDRKRRSFKGTFAHYICTVQSVNQIYHGVPVRNQISDSEAEGRITLSFKRAE